MAHQRIAECRKRKAESPGRETQLPSRGRVGIEGRCRENSKFENRDSEFHHWSESLDVLECAFGWAGADARSDRRERRSVQRMHSGDQNGEDSRLSSGDEHYRL